MNTNWYRVAVAFRTALEQRGQSVHSVAQRAGVPVHVVEAWRRTGVPPDEATARRIVAAIGATLDEVCFSEAQSLLRHADSIIQMQGGKRSEALQRGLQRYRWTLSDLAQRVGVDASKLIAWAEYRAILPRNTLLNLAYWLGETLTALDAAD